MVYHQVVRLHISMNNAVRVRVIKRFEDLVYVKAHVHISELLRNFLLVRGFAEGFKY